MDYQGIAKLADKVRQNVSKVIIGKEEQFDLIFAAMIAGGHVLLEDVPGTGKTMLLRSFAKSVGGNFKRIQFTPDLLPSDLTGINFYNQKLGEFQFRPGPLFSNIVLADEINRATPRTQSSLLEAMEERQITVDGVTTRLEEPFLVMASQNPLESYGTFPLPEAQIDRFFMRLSLGYMKRAQEMQVLARPMSEGRPDDLEQVVTAEETEFVRSAWQQVRVPEPVLGYIMDIIQGTRSESSFVTGISTRGGQALYRGCQAYASIKGRDYVIPEDVQYLAPFILCHRLSSGSGTTDQAKEFLLRVIGKVQVPLETL